MLLDERPFPQPRRGVLPVALRRRRLARPFGGAGSAAISHAGAHGMNGNAADTLSRSALVGESGGRARDYMEKMVQVRVDIPPLREAS